MATRSGSIDPGMLMWVQRLGDLGAEEMEQALDRESGLLGLSGRSGDMREVLTGMDEGDERCRLAFDAYVHRLAGAIAAMATAMSGLDGLAFTGGVGENSARVRERACERVAFLGVAVDPSSQPTGGDTVISSTDSQVAVLVIHAREDVELAAQLRSCLLRG